MTFQHCLSSRYVLDQCSNIISMSACMGQRCCTLPKSSSSSYHCSSVVHSCRLSCTTLQVATAHVWNEQPRHVTSAPFVKVFCSRLNTHRLREISELAGEQKENGSCLAMYVEWMMSERYNSIGFQNDGDDKRGQASIQSVSCWHCTLVLIELAVTRLLYTDQDQVE